MAYSKRVYSLMSLAAVTAVGATLPAQASVAESKGVDAVLAAETVEINVDGGVLAQAVEQSVDKTVPSAELPAEPQDITTINVVEEAGEANLLLPDEPDQSVVIDFDSELLAFDNVSCTTVVENPSGEAVPSNFEESDLAQVTRGRYNEVAPMYLGAGGNIGIGNRDDSGVASFGFSVISKVSLGPRFSVRPGVLVTNQSTSFTVPLTYNFNTLEFANFRFQPYVGAGVDIPTGSNVGLLINAGADVPISRDFTLNAVSNWRVTSGFGLGITLGVGYNFPFIFE
jgi:hypothetical protein